MTPVELKHVTKSFGQHTVCHDVNLKILEGEFVTLLGSSGCGKTTTLNILAGLEDPSSGDIMMSGRRVNDLSPLKRDVAMVFQNYALYPHMTVAQNIGFTLKMRGLRTDDVRARVARVAVALEIGTLLDRLPAQLSGGQQQRVAIGRALVREPKIFLFDEPFSNLDAGLRVKMRAEVKQLHDRLGVTSVFVTHDQEEAMSISDRIAVMNGGRVEQFGTPEDIYGRPLTRYVASFIGSPRVEFFEGVLVADAGRKACRVGASLLHLPQDLSSFVEGQIVDLAIRPEHVSISESGFPATVRLAQPVGPATHVTLDWEGKTLIASLPGFAKLTPGDPTQIRFDPERVLVFDRNTGQRM